MKSLEIDVYTFSLLLSNKTQEVERLKLWVDGAILIDEWSSLSMTDPSATVYFGSTMDLHPIQLEYRYIGNSTTAPSLSFAIKDHLGNESVLAFSSYDVFEGTGSWVDADTGGLLKIIAGATNASWSRCFGSALTIATAGMKSTFSIKGVDSYGNLVDRWEDPWAVTLSTSTTNEVRLHSCACC